MIQNTSELDKGLKGFCLYTPGGAAREYAAVGCNLYRGCPYQCDYCYNRHGMKANVLGVNHPVLLNRFTSRPQRYATMTDEDYAYKRFLDDLSKWHHILRDTGIFFSFTTDPLCAECFDLTWRCITAAVVDYSIPVKVLTKNGALSNHHIQKIDAIPYNRRDLLAFGFTLTGRDDWETGAPRNACRIRLMRLLHSMTFKTFASIEPIIDFESSFQVIKKTVPFCDQYLIGLMSSRHANGLEPYSLGACHAFIQKVHKLLDKYSVPVYWKDSIRDFMRDDPVAMRRLDKGVGKEWSLFHH